jgi:hypothetical protein
VWEIQGGADARKFVPEKQIGNADDGDYSVTVTALATTAICFAATVGV